MKAYKLVIVATAVFGATFAVGQTIIGHEEPIRGQLTIGMRPIIETVAQIRARQAKIKPGAEMRFAVPNEFDEMPPLPQGSGGLGGGSYPGSADPFNQEGPPFLAGVSFAGPGQVDDPSHIPPDTMGGVSNTQIFIPLNGWVAMYTKTGTLTFAVSETTFFDSVRGGLACFDARVWFDRITQRWIVTAATSGYPNRLLFAVSSGATITNTSSFAFYQFTQSTIAPAGNTTDFFDYPTLGVDANGLYMGGNMFNTSNTYTGSAVFVIRKSSILSGGPIVASAFRNIGLQAPMGVNNDDPASTQGLVVGHPTATSLRIHKITNAATTPVLGAAMDVTVPLFAPPGSFPSPGNTINVDNCDSRTMDAQIKLDRISNTRTLWLSHGSRVDSAGNGTFGTGAGNRNGTRFYEVTNLAGTPTLRQAGTLFDSTAANKFTYGSVVMNGQGHAFVGATRFSATEFLGVAGGSRLRTATLGSLSVPQILQAGVANYQIDFGSGFNRWGDYSMTVVDPADDQSFWTFQEYASGLNQWQIRCIQVLAPAPAAIATLAPNTIVQGTTANVVVTGTSVAGTEFFDPGAGFIKRIAAALSGTGLTVNSVTFTDPTHVTLNVTATGAATLGARDLTITNPDGQTSTGPSVLTVLGPAKTLSQTVTLQDHVSPGNRPVTLEIRNVGSTVPLQTFTPTLSGGAYSISMNIASGNYDVAVKGATWLRKKVSTVSFAGSTLTAPAVTLANGDSNNDNVVDLSDYTIVVTAFNAVPSSDNWDVRADLNGDGVVDLTDYTIVVSNFNQIGDN